MPFIIFLCMILCQGIAMAATPIDGLYSNLFGGWAYFPGNFNQNYHGYALNSARYQDGFEAGGTLGYKSNPMRYEFELSYLQANVSSFSLNNVPQTNASGKTDAYLGIANIYYDIPMLTPLLQPYFGGGIGYGYFQIDLNGSQPTAPVAYGADHSNFVYQGVAGVTFNFAENYSINANYRYVGTTNSMFGQVFQVHMANLGATYRYDGVKYK